MSDWPDQFTPRLNRGILSPAGYGTAAAELLNAANSLFNQVTVWVANRAVYMPVCVQYPVTITQMGISVATTGGNVDVGLYSWENTRLVSSGTTATAAAGIQVFNIADTYLVPGWYKIALASDSSVAVFNNSVLAVGLGRICGWENQSSAFVLPNPAVPATYNVTNAPLVVAAYRTGP